MTIPFVLYQMLVQRQAMRLELLGMKHSSGRSIIAHVKKHYGLKGKKEAVLAQFEAIMRESGLLQEAA